MHTMFPKRAAPLQNSNGLACMEGNGLQTWLSQVSFKTKYITHAGGMRGISHL